MAIEHARREAAAYLGSLWVAVEEALRAASDETHPWLVRDLWQSNGDIIGIDYWRPFDGDDVPFASSKRVEPMLRVEDARAGGISGTVVRARLGFWLTEVGRQFQRKFGADITGLEALLRENQRLEVRLNRKSDWYFADVSWKLEFVRLAADVDQAVENIRVIENAYNQLLDSVARH